MDINYDIIISHVQAVNTHKYMHTTKWEWHNHVTDGLIVLVVVLD